MEGLTDAEYQRLQRLQEVCPLDDISDLYQRASPYLLTEETFNYFLDELMEKKVKLERENEEEEEKIFRESLTIAFTKQIPHDPPPRPLLKTMTSLKRKRDEPARRSNDRSVRSATEKELDLILYGNVSDLVRNNYERRMSIETDSDESYHSLEDDQGKNKIETVDLVSDNDDTTMESNKNCKDFSSFNKLIMKKNENVCRKSEPKEQISRIIHDFFASPKSDIPEDKEKEKSGKKQEVKNLEIPDFPFIYVVKESRSPNFCLPKGNYLITNTVPSVDGLGAGFKILHHPPVVEKTPKESEPEPVKKSELEPLDLDEIVPFNPDELVEPPTCSTPKGKGKGKSVNGYMVKSGKKNVSSVPENRTQTNVSPVFLDCSLPGTSKDPDYSIPGPSTQPDYPFPSTGRSLPVLSGDILSGIDDEEDLEGDVTISSMLSALKNSDPEYIKKELENCGDDVELQKKVIEREMERSLQSDKETEMIRAGWQRILTELPQHDSEYLLDKWTEMAGDDLAIDSFIQEEKVKSQLIFIKKELIYNLPSLEREYLEAKANDFLFDNEGLRSFIASEKKKMVVDEQYRYMVNELPLMDPALLRERCEEFQGDAARVEDYIRKAKQREEEERNIQIANMLEVFRDADPAFLEQKSREYQGDTEGFNLFLSELMEKKNYPKYDAVSQEREEMWRRFVDKFNLAEFLGKVPDPEEYYYGAKGDDKTDLNFITKFLKFRYPDSSVQHLERTFEENSRNLTNTCSQLDLQLRTVEMMDESFRKENIPESFFLEMVYILHRRDFRQHFQEKKELRDLQVEEARSRNSLLTCSCCYDDELLEAEVTACPEGHIVCIKCVTRYVELKLGEGVTKFVCTTEECGTEYILSILEKVLPRNLYDKVLSKKQSAEVSEAGVSGVESCPSCHFAYIPNHDDKIFQCRNPDCLKEICRKCKEDNHIPLRCEEVEKPKDTQIRREIEEKMTDALLRTCHRCGKRFLRNGGCNVMTCTCGAMMCYVCRRPLDRYGCPGACPTYDERELHVAQVRRVGEAVRDQALRENPDVHLIHDPTKTL